VLTALLYYLDLSLRKTSEFMSYLQEISHESVRTYYHKIKEVIKSPEKRNRRLIAVDETKMKIENTQVFVWSTIDVDTKECLAIWVSKGRSSFERTYFSERLLNTIETDGICCR